MLRWRMVAGAAALAVVIAVPPGRGAGAVGVAAPPGPEAAAVAAPAPAAAPDGGAGYWDVSPLLPAVQHSVVGVVAHRPAAFGRDAEWFTAGTGLIYRHRYVITAARLVDGAGAVTVLLPSGRLRQVPGSAVRVDDVTGLAVLDAGPGLGTTADLGANADLDGKADPAITDSLRPGQPVMAVGNPMGLRLRNSVTVGIVSAVETPAALPGVPRRSWLGEPLYLQTDAPTVLGAEGGPLVDGGGRVAGINVAKAIGLGVEGVSYALPAPAAVAVADALIDAGQVSRAWLGIQVGESPAAAAGLDEPLGLQVTGVHPAGPGAGLLWPGDRIVATGGRPVQRVADLDAALAGLGVGDAIVLSVLRHAGTDAGGFLPVPAPVSAPTAVTDVTLTLAERPPLVEPPLGDALWRHLTLAELEQAATFAHRHRHRSQPELTLAWRAQARAGQALLVSEFLAVALPLHAAYARGEDLPPNAVFWHALQSRGHLTIWVALAGAGAAGPSPVVGGDAAAVSAGDPATWQARLVQDGRALPGTLVPVGTPPPDGLAAPGGARPEGLAAPGVAGFRFPSAALDPAAPVTLVVSGPGGQPLATFAWDLQALR